MAKLVIGVNKLARAVVTTLGPKGRRTSPLIRSGVPPRFFMTVFLLPKEVELQDPF